MNIALTKFSQHSSAAAANGWKSGATVGQEPRRMARGSSPAERPISRDARRHHGRWDAPQDTTQCIWWWTHWAGCTAWTRRCKNVQLGERWFEDRLFFFVNLSFQWFESIFLFILLVGANKPAKRVRGMCNCWSKLGGEFVYQTCCFFSPNGGR